MNWPLFILVMGAAVFVALVLGGCCIPDPEDKRTTEDRIKEIADAIERLPF